MSLAAFELGTPKETYERAAAIRDVTTSLHIARSFMGAGQVIAIPHEKVSSFVHLPLSACPEPCCAGPAASKVERQLKGFVAIKLTKHILYRACHCVRLQISRKVRRV